MGRVPRLLVLLLSGAGFALAFPQASWWPLALVTLIPLVSFLSAPGKIPAALGGWAWGMGFFGWLLSWLYHYGEMNRPISILAWLILIGYLSIYPGLFAHFGSLLVQAYGAPGFAVLPFLWVALEWVRGHALTGVPWGLAGYSLVGCLPLLQVVSLTGIYGASFLVLCPNVLGGYWLHKTAVRGGRWISGVSVLGLYAASLVFGFFELSRVPQGPSLRVGIVQGNIPQDQKWDSGIRAEILERHEQLSGEAAGQGARLVVWPESSTPYSLSHPSATQEGMRVKPSAAFRARLEDLAQRLGVTLLFGAVDYRETEHGPLPINAAALIRSNGDWGETYAKIHLVPFGEYVPLARVLFFVQRLVEGAIGEFLPGEKAVVVEVDGISFGSFICYEAIFPELVRQFSDHGAEVLVNLTNDAWFRMRSGPQQHFEMAAVRAVENRRYLVRAANTGISGVTDPWGRVVARTELEETEWLVTEVRSMAERSFYVRIGDLFAYLCVILASAALAAGYWLRRGVSQGGVG